MSLTRREFSAAASAAVALTVLGCDRKESAAGTAAGPSAGGQPGPGSPGNPNRAKLATEPFLVGPAKKYAKAAVYDEYKNPQAPDKNKGVYLVSDGKELVALSATCTHSACSVKWVAEKEFFDCPCHHTKFDVHGANQEGGRAKRPLERCALSEIDTPDGKQVQVDPRKLFRKDKGEWSDPAASLKLPQA